MKYVLWLFRIVVGVLFIFSGLIKANDPSGLSYKMNEFFEVWHMYWAMPYSLALSIAMIGFEIIAGAAHGFLYIPDRLCVPDRQDKRVRLLWRLYQDKQCRNVLERCGAADTCAHIVCFPQADTAIVRRICYVSHYDTDGVLRFWRSVVCAGAPSVL